MIRMLTGLRDWVDERLPIVRAWDTHMGKYYAPKNFNFWYIFGVLSLLVLVNQLLTGVWLTMSYVPTAEGAFRSVEYITPPAPRRSLRWCTCICSAACCTAPIKSRANWCGSSAC